jgi:hypothetical protein
MDSFTIMLNSTTYLQIDTRDINDIEEELQLYKNILQMIPDTLCFQA